MNKHAYLIMAHNQFDLLKKLLVLLDDERNDFYIHIDKKAKKFKEEEIKCVVQNSKIIFVQRHNVNWGGYSAVQAELSLLEGSAKGNYTYYHLISGADFAIKTKDEIYNFFEQQSNKEFIQFEQKEFPDKFKDRICYYHYFREMQSSSFILQKLDKLSIKLQQMKNVDRTKLNKLCFQKGSQWFSITNEFAHYVVSKKEEIEQVFSNTSCADEIFLQTLLVNSPFKQNLYHQEFDDNCNAIKRFIDWKRGTPYVFHVNDFEELIHSDHLFARKFDLEEDSEIVQKIFDYLMKKKD